MANPLKKNTQNDKPSNAARPETAKPGARSVATSPVAAQPPTATPVGKARRPAQDKTPWQTGMRPQTEEPNRLPWQEQVEKRAYQIFQARGGEHGRHLEDWEQAEHELKLGMH